MSAMTQTTALFVDAYRELNARKMFWITLILSGVCIIGFGLVGVGSNGLTIFGTTLPVPAPRFFYKWAFSAFLVGLWAKWFALILALISTASIFPELIASGSIDLYLSKPISRLRLFLTKYATGLLFVALQTSIFALGSYLVFGFRAGEWRPALFLMIPLVLLLYSYLFCVCVLIGVMTRSTIAAILLTVLFWLVCWGINSAEQALFAFKTMQSSQARAQDRQARRADAELVQLKEDPSVTNLFGVREARIKARRDDARRAADEAKQTAEKLGWWHRLAYGVATAIPKTGETVDLLDRKLFDDADLAALRDRQGGDRGAFGEPADFGPPPAQPTTNPAEVAAQAEEDARDREARRQAMQESADETNRAARGRSVPWILGTSLGFEAVVLTLAAWVFSRRDY